MRRLSMIFVGIALLLTVGLAGIASATPNAKAFDSVVVGPVQVLQTPNSVQCGAEYSLSTTFQNTGSAPWNSEREDHVVAVATNASLHDSFRSKRNPKVEPNDNGLFTFHLIAPKKAGQYSVSVQLAKVSDEPKRHVDTFGATAAGVVTVTCGAADPVLTGLKVTPASPTVAAGLTVQFDAVGTYSDGSTQDLTPSVTWAVTGTAATISNTAGSQGLATGVSAGTGSVTATSGSVTSSPVTLTVGPAVLTGLKVTPASPTVAAGLTVQFDAVGTYSDGSTQDLTTSVTWAVTGTAATISNAAGIQGMATGVSAGTGSVTATLGSVTSPPVTLTVTTATCTVGPSSGFSCSVTAEGTSCFVQLPAPGATWVLKDLTTNTPLTGGLTPAFVSVGVTLGHTIQLSAATSGVLNCT
jgi:Bacterial Ig-like domain (group 2)